MRKSMFSLMIGVVALGVAATLQAQTKSSAEALDARIHAVNETAKKADDTKVVLDRVATETGIPRDQVQAMHKKHTDVGAGGLLVSGVLANETKKEPQQFLREHEAGKSWAAICRENKVSLDRVTERLDRFEKELPKAKSK